MGYQETVKQALAHPHYKAPLKPNQGRGVASGYWFNAGGESSAQMSINEDGSVVVMTGHPTSAARAPRPPTSPPSCWASTTASPGADRRHQQHRLLEPDRRQPRHLRVRHGGHAGGEKVITQLRQRAAKIWKIDPDAITWDNGEAKPAGDNAGKFDPLSLAQLAARATETGGPIGAGASTNTAGARGGFSTHICDVEVDATPAESGSRATPPSRISIMTVSIIGRSGDGHAIVEKARVIELAGLVCRCTPRSAPSRCPGRRRPASDPRRSRDGSPGDILEGGVARDPDSAGVSRSTSTSQICV